MEAKYATNVESSTIRKRQHQHAGGENEEQQGQISKKHKKTHITLEN
jgi:hypothetical protein